MSEEIRVCLIRHGSTAGNLEHRYVSTTDESLTEAAAETLRRQSSAYPEADLVFTSPLKRCIETAAILFPGIPSESVEGLAECRFGAFEYKNYQELQGDDRYQAWLDSAGTLPFPGGESRDAFIERCCGAFLSCCRLAVRRGCRSAAFVVHGGTIMAVLDRLSDPNRSYFDWQVKNGEGFEGVFCQERIKNVRAVGPTGVEELYVMKQNKKLRCGYTTGSCAAAAAKAAAEMLLTGCICHRAKLLTPKGILLTLPMEDQKICLHEASCAVRKFGGDDPDATDGLLIYAKVRRMDDASGKSEEDDREDNMSTKKENHIVIDGGFGVGRVTKPGLEQPVGAAAINRVPRAMIRSALEEVCEKYHYQGGLEAVISVPEGERIARKTFNPHIDILGGISILGTSGIVVPMSEDALIASIRLEMQQKYANGERVLLVTPGNYGADFIRKKELTYALDVEHSMKCSNYVGETLDMAAELGFQGILFIAHIGKFIKVSGGIMNTHSGHADCRSELMTAQALRAAGDRISPELTQRLLAANTTEEAVELLKETGLLEETMLEITKRIKFHLQKRCGGVLKTEAVIYSNRFGFLGETDGAEAMMEQIAAESAAHVIP